MTPLPECAVILDLGSNVGFTSFDYATLYPTCRIIAVEMDDENVALSKRNLEMVSENCTVKNAAIWFENREITYAKGEEEWAYKAEPDLAQTKEKLHTVRALTIDKIMEDFGIDWVDFVKMDIEGAEDKVIHQGAAWLKKIGSLNMEIHAPAHYEQFEAILSAEGFSCQKSVLHPNALIATRSHSGVPTQ